jgi:acetylornithine deacetylase/succinyl-diaminopimelate desuccinylase-like protein
MHANQWSNIRVLVEFLPPINWINARASRIEQRAGLQFRARRGGSMPLRYIFLSLALLLGADAASARQTSSIGEQLLKEPAVEAALAAVQRDEARVLEEQVQVCEIPAPPFKEQARGADLARRFTALGLRSVRTDAVGNVLGERPGTGDGARVVISAHLDTVFPEETDVRTSRSGAVIKGPGIADDCRGLAVLLAIVRTMNEAGLTTPGTITFVGTVGEEGLGDLRGVKHLFHQELKGRIDRFVSIDGAGLGITATAVGSRRYRVTFTGPGGHSYSAFGNANPIHALGRAIGKTADLRVPAQPRTTFNVGRVGGGTSVNSIAFEAWMEVDLRSADAAALAALDSGFHAAVDEALARENERWKSRGRISADRKLVGDRPGGSVPESSPIVQAAVSVTRALGLPVDVDEGSTDSNIPISLGIPAVTIDGGGSSTGTHSLDETFDSTDSWQGTARALLLTLALAR